MQLALHTLDQITVLTDPQPSFRERLGATELRRGLHRLGYRGRLVAGTFPGPDSTADRSELRFELTSGTATGERYDIRTEQAGPHLTVVAIDGSNEASTLYGVFDLLERQGAYFGIDGDTYPLGQAQQLYLPDQEQPWVGTPRFGVRGLLPWPDFLNCVSVYNREDWRAYLESMLRMRFNTLGVHVYGQRDKWAESFLSVEYGGVGHAAFLDTTATDRWGYLPQRTSRYGMGAAQYFDGEVFGADATRLARSPWEAAEMSQALWREAFAYAEQLGIRTGVGFEPYQVPDEIYRAAPPEARVERTYHFHGAEHRFKQIDPQSRAARTILERRLSLLLEAYPSVSHVYLWEDEFANWASQYEDVELSAAPFLHAHDFLRRHAPDKRLVLAGWGGVARTFAKFHRALPEDVIFTCLSDQVGWDAVHEAFKDLDARERWPIPWIEDDPAMWFPQLHVHRFQRDMALAEQYGCQGVLGIHWRHRIVDHVSGYMARRAWQPEVAPLEHYRAYARTQAAGPRVEPLAQLLDRADRERSLLSTWLGDFQPDGRHTNRGFSGDYHEAFTVEQGHAIPDDLLERQARVIAELGALLEAAETPAERERLGYWEGQIRFLDPYARAWRVGVELQALLASQLERRRSGDPGGAAEVVHERGVPLWAALLGHVRDCVLAFQHTVATRNDLGMLASVHNKFVRIATFRFRESLLEFIDSIPTEVDALARGALAPDTREGAVFVPTRPTRLAPGEQVTITAVAPGARELVDVTLRWRPAGGQAWAHCPMRLVGRRTYAYQLVMPPDAELGVEYVVEATFAGAPPLRAVAPPPGVEPAYLVTV